MKTNLKLLLFSFLAFNFITFQILHAQFIKGDGNVTETDRAISNIHFVEVQSGIDLYLTQGEQENLKIEADQNLQEYIKIEIEGDHLKIYLSKIVRQAKSLKAYITLKDIQGISASGGSDLYGQNLLNVNELSVICSGGSDATFEVNANELKFKASGGSDGYIKGNTKSFKAKASGGSDIKASKLVTGDCQIELSGGSDAAVNANGELIIKASGGSDVSYTGTPTRIDSNMSGGSGLHRN